MISFKRVGLQSINWLNLSFTYQMLYSKNVMSLELTVTWTKTNRKHLDIHTLSPHLLYYLLPPNQILLSVLYSKTFLHLWMCSVLCKIYLQKHFLYLTIKKIFPFPQKVYSNHSHTPASILTETVEKPSHFIRQEDFCLSSRMS